MKEVNSEEQKEVAREQNKCQAGTLRAVADLLEGHDEPVYIFGHEVARVNAEFEDGNLPALPARIRCTEHSFFVWLLQAINRAEVSLAPEPISIVGKTKKHSSEIPVEIDARWAAKIVAEGIQELAARRPDIQFF